MADKSDAAPGGTLRDNLQFTVIAMARFSGALALYGIKSMRTAISCRKGEGLPRAAEDFGTVLDSMSQCVMDQMERSTREAAHSAAKMAEQVFQQSLGSLSLMDPRRMVRVANNLLRKSAQAIFPATRSRKATDDYQDDSGDDDRPRLAVEVLSSSEI